jgi:LysR family transcriptional regulator, glycine cleavage system transcriptional activator
MTHRPPPLALLRTFEAAARHLSFKKAAAELHVTPAAVSQQMRTLEGRLGVQLFRRLTRALQLSERGAAMLPKVQEAFACLAEAMSAAQAPVGERAVIVTAPPSFATHWLIPRLPDFYAAHPGIEVRLSSTSATVDHAGDSSVLDALEAAAGDACCALAVLYGTGGYGARFSVDELMAPEYLPVCAPRLLAAQPPITAPADLLRHVLIHDDTVGAGGDGGSAWGWAQWMGAARIEDRGDTSGRRFSNAVLAIEAALAGQGVALLARPLVAAQLAAGTLVVAFDLGIASPYRYFLVGNRSEAERPAVVEFRQWLLAQAEPPAPDAAGAEAEREAGSPSD